MFTNENFKRVVITCKIFKDTQSLEQIEIIQYDKIIQEEATTLAINKRLYFAYSLPPTELGGEKTEGGDIQNKKP